MKKEIFKRLGALVLALALLLGSVPFMSVQAETVEETTQSQNQIDEEKTITTDENIIYDDTVSTEVIEDEPVALSQETEEDLNALDEEEEDAVDDGEDEEEEETPDEEAITYSVTFSGKTLSFSSIVVTDENGNVVELNETKNGFEAEAGVQYIIRASFDSADKRWLNYKDYKFTESIDEDTEIATYVLEDVEFDADTNYKVEGIYNLQFTVGSSNKDKIEKITVSYKDDKDKDVALSPTIDKDGNYTFRVNEDQEYYVDVNLKAHYRWKDYPSNSFTEEADGYFLFVFPNNYHYETKNNTSFTEDTVIPITFKNEYKVVCKNGDSEYGEIVTENGNTSDDFDAGSYVSVLIKPNLEKGGVLKSLKVNDEDVDISNLSFDTTNLGYEYTLNEALVQDVKVVASFEQAEFETWEYEGANAPGQVSYSHDYGHTEINKTIYVSQENVVTLSLNDTTPLYTNIGQIDDNNNIQISSSTANENNPVIAVYKKIVVDETKKITKNVLSYIRCDFKFKYSDRAPGLSSQLEDEWFNPTETTPLTVSGTIAPCQPIYKVVYSSTRLTDKTDATTNKTISVKEQLWFCSDASMLATVDGNNFSFTLEGSSRPTENTTYYIYIMDWCCNYIECTKTFNADSTAPTVHFNYQTSFIQNLENAIVNHATSKETIDIKVTATDNESGVKSFTLYVNGEAVANKNAVNGACKFEDVSLKTNGKNIIKISATDNVRNTSLAVSYKENEDDENESDRPIYQDSVKPVVTLSAGTNMLKNDDGTCYFNNYDNLEVYVTAEDVKSAESDEPSGIDNMAISLDGKTIKNINVNNESVAISDYFNGCDSRATTETLKLTTAELGELEEGRNYTLTVTAYDCAGNASETMNFNIFYDKTAPEIKAFMVEEAESEIPISYTNEEGFYGYFVNDAATLKVIANDFGGVGLDYVEFYTVAADSTKTDVTKYYPSAEVVDDEENSCDEPEINGNEDVELNESAGFIEAKEDEDSDDDTKIYIQSYDANENDEVVYIPLQKDFKGYVFVRAMDKVGNIQDKYTTTSGVITETPELHETQEDAHVALTTETTTCKDAAGNNLYNHDTEVAVQVNDVVSGIRNVTWTVESKYDTSNNHDGKVSIDGNVVAGHAGKMSIVNTVGDSLKGTDNSSWEITSEDKNLVTGMKYSIPVANNSNDIVITVTVTDRAGNTTTESTTISIDKTAPTVTIEYDNNDADKEYTTYYNANRTATITVTERNFSSEDFTLNMSSTGASTPSLSKWVETKNLENPDLTTYKASLVFDTDGDYTFDATFHDMAGNNASEMFDKQAFTIDKTNPVIEISFDNNSAMNGNYYKASRTATIKITEHNFDAKRVTVTGTASDDGATKTFPSISSFTTNGDVNTATITFDADGDYKFSVDCNDKARNAAQTVSADEFVVDLTVPEVTISGVEDMSANNGDVAPVIVMSDTNYDVNNIEINLVGSNNGSVNYARSEASSDHGQTVTYANFKEEQSVDDIYTLEATATDKAGNATTETITFSVNRFGSVYTLSDATKSILGTYTNTPVDVEITETNVNELSMDDIQLVVSYNGTPVTLTEGSDFTVSKTNVNSGWSQYSYKIGKEYFDNDGVYSVSIYSVDIAGNMNENTDETKKAECNFGIDTTAPVIVPITIDSNEIYNAQTYEANLSINDNLVLENVEATVNGQAVEVTSDGEDYTLPIAEDSAKQAITVTATDAAGNSVSYSADNIIVSTNAAVRIYNNKKLFVSLCAGVLTGCVIAIFVVRSKTKKKAKVISK